MKTRDFKNTSEYESHLLYAFPRDTTPEFKQYIQRLACQGLPLVPALLFSEQKGGCWLSESDAKEVPTKHQPGTCALQAFSNSAVWVRQ